MILETDRQANIEDGFIRDLKLVGGLFQSKPLDVLLRRFTHRIGKYALEVKRGVAVFPGEGLQIQISIQILLDIHE